ncbi:MAG: hypothetical protein AMJ95_10495 [Omnitrophica WOR_2 bacterium SM23_72]|nr:MAG: hypothetical protein AMJ95_10495 [Omnitrophica WOR_2 bacterium SM23_72]
MDEAILTINYLRDKDLKYLSDAKLLELDLLPKLGLHNNWINQAPDEFYPFMGHGLYLWQYPNQFSKYLVHLSQFKIDTYLEIGVNQGGSFIMTTEYLKRFNKLKYAIAVDIKSFPIITEYRNMNPLVNYMLVDTRSAAFKELIKNHPGFDLVLIDGDHTEEGCRNDFEIIKDKANIFVLHDIVDDFLPGVRKVWNEIKGSYADEYVFFEYTDQYESAKRKYGSTRLGIGMAIRKSFLNVKM